jgi:hypothetical protein
MLKLRCRTGFTAVVAPQLGEASRARLLAKLTAVDAQGAEYRLDVNRAGNFMLEGANLALPYTAKVVVGGAERITGGVQPSCDCNSCLTQQGVASAPGRIVLP